MAEKDAITKEKIEETGIFDFAGLYSYAHSWLRDQENYGVIEDTYSEKVVGTSRDIDIKWKAAKGLSDYFKVEIELKWEIKGLSEVEVEIDGVKKKMNKGKVTLEIKGALVRDPDGKWETGPYLKFVRDVYSKYVIPSRVDDMRLKVLNDVVAFKEALKSYLELTGNRLQRTFIPTK